MNRRGFLGLFGAAAVAPLVPMPELAELLAPTRTIFLPPRGGWNNRLLTVEQITREMLRVFSVQMEFMAERIPRMYDDEFLKGSQWPEGEMSRVITRKPPRYDVRVNTGPQIGDKIIIDGLFKS